MGNRSSSGGKRRGDGASGKGKATITNGKQSSFDDLSTRTKADDKLADQKPRLNLKLYRSVSQTDQTDQTDTRPDIRLHRRSMIVGGHARALETEPHARPMTDAANTSNHWATRTLPRSFGRTGSSASSGVLSSPDDDIVLRHRQASKLKQRRRPTSEYSTSETRRNQTLRPSSSFGISEEETAEFPDSETIRRRTASFQRHFVGHFMTLYAALPTAVQLSALSIAVRRRCSQSIKSVNHTEPSSAIVISLRHYLDAGTSCTDVPLQLPASEYALTISPGQFNHVQQSRMNSCEDPAALARLLVTGVATEAAKELIRAFEYQIVLLGDEEGLGARLCAQRGAERAMDYLKRTSHHVDVNSLVRGVVEGRPSGAPATVSVIVGHRRELQWNLDDLFHRPGLRRERLLVAGGVDAVAGYGTPWRFYASTHGTDSTLYGYRTQLPVRDFDSEWLRGGRQPSYRLDAKEEATYDVEVPWRSDDFHRTYRPYRRLVGFAVMASYAALSDQDKASVSLSDHVQQLQGDAFRRDEVEPVIKPLMLDYCGEEPVSRVTGLNWDLNCNHSHAGVFCQEPSDQSAKSLLSNNCHAFDHMPSDGGAESAVLTMMDRKTDLALESNSSAKFDQQRTSTMQTVSNCSSSDQPATGANTSHRRPPPPTVKPKPSRELIRHLSATSPTKNPDTDETSFRRQTSQPGDTGGSNQVAEVRFPTLDELFGRELMAIRRASSHVQGCADNSIPSFPSFHQQTGSTTMTSSGDIDGVAVAEDPSHQSTTLLVSDI